MAQENTDEAAQVDAGGEYDGQALHGQHGPHDHKYDDGQGADDAVAQAVGRRDFDQNP